MERDVEQMLRSGDGGLVGASMARMPSMQERLQHAEAQAKDRLAKVQRAQELLAKNPDLEELLNIMQAAHF